MADFKFLHAADLHLDSPLLGLAGRSAEFAVRLEQASRAAFDNLIDLAIAEGCRFVVLAGDIFDGNLHHMPTGLFFLSRMRRLEDAGIAVPDGRQPQRYNECAPPEERTSSGSTSQLGLAVL